LNASTLSTESSPVPSLKRRLDTSDESESHDLSNAERINILNKKKKPRVTYNGNPDLQPVRTYEIAKLVSVLNEISQRLNEKVSHFLKNILLL